MDTLLLAVDTWDFVLDAAGNWARASVPYARAQDVASACRVFLGEVWYDDTLGIPFATKILGQAPPAVYFQEQFVSAALSVDGVVAAQCVITEFDRATRTVKGQVQFTDADGNTGSIQI
jgi:hypothetical protein